MQTKINLIDSFFSAGWEINSAKPTRCSCKQRSTVATPASAAPCNAAQPCYPIPISATGEMRRKNHHHLHWFSFFFPLFFALSSPCVFTNSSSPSTLLCFKAILPHRRCGERHHLPQLHRAIPVPWSSRGGMPLPTTTIMPPTQHYSATARKRTRYACASSPFFFSGSLATSHALSDMPPSCGRMGTDPRRGEDSLDRGPSGMAHPDQLPGRAGAVGVALHSLTFRAY